ncbi:MAG: nucleotide exchange factor GrpE [Gemmatales bacterium]|nr:nucleotide exchange factor GrpE [Gemmatales bacterium]MDW7995641.1 nucleotide exchange factor GrpE [Gemmatales bacterium]
MSEEPTSSAQPQTSETTAAPETAAPESAVQDNAAASQVLADLEQLMRERDTFKELLLRTRADFENYQKRIAKERDQERRYALWPLALDLLSVLDNLQRALDSVQEDSPLRQGVVMIYNQLQNLLKKHGITLMEAQGQPFDPHLHQAVLQQPSAEHPPNTVIKVLEAGYYYHDRVLRPARVVVSKSPSEEESPEAKLNST